MSFPKTTEVIRIIGPPGTGKTTWLYREMLRLIQEEKLDETNIAFVSFTRQAIARMMEKLEAHDLGGKDRWIWFRTIHSFSKLLTDSAKRSAKIISTSSYDNIAWNCGVRRGQMLQCNYKTQKFTDYANQIYAYARNNDISLKESWERHTVEFPVSWVQVAKYIAAVERHKQETRQIDFFDMLSNYCDSALNFEVRYLFIDEAQDLSVAQWAVAHKLGANSKRVYVAGDPNQAIYGWAGSSAKTFIEMPVKQEIVLDTSYRLPVKVHEQSQEFLAAFKEPFDYAPQKGAKEGEFRRWPRRWSLLNENPEESWFVLARNCYTLTEIAKQLNVVGVPWEFFSSDESSGEAYYRRKALYRYVREYLHKCYVAKTIDVVPVEAIQEIRTRRGRPNHKHLWQHFSRFDEVAAIKQGLPWVDVFDRVDTAEKAWLTRKLRRQPMPQLATFHGVKGHEADNVLIFPDLTMAEFNKYSAHDPEETLPIYVALTRAKKRVYLEWQPFSANPDRRIRWERYFSV